MAVSPPPQASDSTLPAPKPKEDIVGWLDLPNKDQLFILAVCRLSEPLSNVCLLPYIFYLVRSVLSGSKNPNATREATGDSTGDGDVATPAQISAYSGLLVASFSLAQFVVSLPWGRLSDSHGRKFSIVIGIAISVISNAAFGFSRSFGALLFWRTLAGLSNGNVGIMRTMTAEIVKERRFQTKAFLLLPLVFNSGMVVSLALGGLLAEPVVNLAWLFGPAGILNWAANSQGVQWAIDYPYALPAVINAGMLGFAFLLAVFWLRETLPGKEEDRDICLRIGHAAVHWFQASVLRRRELSYLPLNDVEDVVFDSSQDDRPLGLSAELDGNGSKVDKEGDAASYMETVSLAPPTRAKPSLRSILTGRTMAAFVSFALLPLHNSAFMVSPIRYLSRPSHFNDQKLTSLL